MLDFADEMAPDVLVERPSFDDLDFLTCLQDHGDSSGLCRLERRSVRPASGCLVHEV
jgi:hypothetical protein